MAHASSVPPETQHPADDRRGFLGKLAAVVIGVVVSLVPLVVGLITFFDPLRRKSASAAMVRVAALDALPVNGLPRQFPVVAEHTDAWTHFPNEQVGAVYLRRLPEGQAAQDKVAPDKGDQAKIVQSKIFVEAFSATCPHAGCFVAFNTERDIYQCPCHTSSFTMDGAVINPSPSPRAMDQLECEVRDNAGAKEIWVRYQNFYPGKAEKIAKP